VSHAPAGKLRLLTLTDSGRLRFRLSLDIAVDWFVRFWHYRLLRHAWGRIILFFLIIGPCVLRAYSGMIGSRAFTHDGFMLLDGAWRMLQGQRPHLDFYSHVGFLTYLPTAVGLQISGGTAWGLGYGQAVSAFLLGIWTFLIGRKRLSDVPLVLMCACVVFMAAAPFALGFSPMKTSPAMIYNRQGYAFLALILLEAFQPNERLTRRDELWGGVSTGGIVSILFFLKITYFVTGLFLLLALLPCKKQSKQRWMGIALGLLAVTASCCGYYGFQMKPLLHDLLTIGGGKRIHFGWYVIDGVLQDSAIAAGFALSAALLLSACQQLRAAFAVAIAGLAVAFAGVALIFGNYEQNGFPMAAFLAIVALNIVIFYASSARDSFRFFQSAVLLMGSVFIFGSLLSGGIGMAFAVGQRLWLHQMKAFEMSRLSGFTAGPDDDGYAAMVNDGIPLVEQYRRPNDRLMSLDFTNPFSYGLGMRPAYGGTTVLQFGTTFNDRFKPSPEFLMGAADLIAVPKKASDGTLDDSIPRLYGAFLGSHYREIGESREWRLYRRNGE
jgi:hypothetical protein